VFAVFVFSCGVGAGCRVPAVGVGAGGNVAQFLPRGAGVFAGGVHTFFPLWVAVCQAYTTG
jgi:hypothetical protein